MRFVIGRARNVVGIECVTIPSLESVQGPAEGGFRSSEGKSQDFCTYTRSESGSIDIRSWRMFLSIVLAHNIPKTYSLRAASPNYPICDRESEKCSRNRINYHSLESVQGPADPGFCSLQMKSQGFHITMYSGSGSIYIRSWRMFYLFD